jgi:GT2 family glycosyltransferase
VGARFPAAMQSAMTGSTVAHDSRSPRADGMVFAIVPVFNRWLFTRDCIEDLRRQTYPLLSIIVSDGGSTDDTRANLRDYKDVVLVYDNRERWWAGSTALGIDEALRRGQDGDFVLLLNNDTRIAPDYVEKLVRCSREHDAAVAGLILDSCEPARVLDAGEFIDWKAYAFPVKTEIAPGETFFDGVDTLSGRGSLVPLPMVRAVGNVDDKTFPHYIADYDWFCRIKAAGFRLGVCYEARLLAHAEATGIAPSAAVKPLAQVLRAIFSRRSMANFRDHWRFIARHAPAQERARLLRLLCAWTFGSLIYQTPLNSLVAVYRRLAHRYPVLRRLRALWTR